MIEILVSLVIAAVALPFVMRDMDGRVRRAENVRVARDISATRDALEKYIQANKRDLFAPTGRTITRVRIGDLAQYGNLPQDYEKFQARIIKSRDRGGNAVLSGLVVFNSDGISPLRTREITELGGASSGFIEKNEAYGAYGTWRSRVNIFDAKFAVDNSIAQSTGTFLSGGDFLWRLPSDDALDATMATGLSMGGYDIKNASSVNAFHTRTDEIANANLITARKVQISPRATLDSALVVSGETLVQGAMTSDSRNMGVAGDLFLNDSARISRLDARALWVGDLNLSGLSLGGGDKPNILKVAQTIDMVRGRVAAMTVTVGFAGTVTPRLIVSDRIEDAGNPGFYWDLVDENAELSDVQATILTPMIKNVVRAESRGQKTEAENTMSMLISNSNATLGDFVRALDGIQGRVRAKYNNLNLEQNNL